MNYKQYFEQLEICKELINSNSSTKNHMALILLDSLNDSICYRYFLREFEDESIFMWLGAIRIEYKERKYIKKSFHPKIKNLKKIGLLPHHHYLVMNIGHYYRNAICHRGQTYTPIIKTLNVLLFETSCFLIQHISNKYSLGYLGGFSLGKKQKREIKNKYKINTDFFNTDTHVTKILKFIKRGLNRSTKKICNTFYEDIKTRVDMLVKHIDSIPLLFRMSLNNGIKFHEFNLENEILLEKLASKYKADKKILEPKYYLENRKKYEEELQKFRESYKPKLGYGTIELIKKRFKKIKSYSKKVTSLVEYNKIDKTLSKLEACIHRILLDIDKYEDIQMDIARGK